MHLDQDDVGQPPSEREGIKAALPRQRSLAARVLGLRRVPQPPHRRDRFSRVVDFHAAPISVPLSGPRADADRLAWRRQGHNRRLQRSSWLQFAAPDRPVSAVRAPSNPRWIRTIYRECAAAAVNRPFTESGFARQRPVTLAATETPWPTSI